MSDELTCKGSWLLKNNCETCSRCVAEKKKLEEYGRQQRMKPWTVMLLYPPELQEEGISGSMVGLKTPSTYVALVDAENISMAEKTAQKQANQALPPLDRINHLRFTIMYVAKGHHRDARFVKEDCLEQEK